MAMRLPLIPRLRHQPFALVPRHGELLDRGIYRGLGVWLIPPTSNFVGVPLTW